MKPCDIRVIHQIDDTSRAKNLIHVALFPYIFEEEKLLLFGEVQKWRWNRKVSGRNTTDLICYMAFTLNANQNYLRIKNVVL
jgi:hypothetical protein